MDLRLDTAVTDELLLTTRSIRRRLDLEREVDPAVVRDCIRLATHAPNASNGQTWRWIVVTDPALRARVAEVYRGAIEPPMTALLEQRRQAADHDMVRHSEAVLALAEHFHRVPVLVIPCIRGELSADLSDQAWMWGSILPAVWSFQLALRSRGLGCVHTTAHLLGAPEVAELLGIPDGWVQTCCIPVAHITGDRLTPPARRPVDEVIAWNAW